jgi:hypothetical protein
MTSSEYTAKIQSLFAQIEALQKQITDLQKEYLGQPTSNNTTTSLRFTSEMKEGMTSEDIRLLQRLLATDPAIYADGRQTGYFGPLTKEAISNFQTRYGISSELGFVGPTTLKYLNAVLEEAGIVSSIPANTLANDSLTAKVKAKVSGQSTATSNPGNSKEKICLNGNTLEMPSVAISVLISHNSNAYKGSCKSSDNSNDTGSKDVKEFEVEINDDRSYITVIFENGKKDSFVSPFFDHRDIIEDLSDRYDIDQDDIEDLIDFIDFSEVDEIIAVINEDDDETEVTVEYESGDEKEFTVKETDEDDIIEEVAEELDMDEDDVEDIIEFEDKDDKKSDDIEEIEVTVEDGRAYVVVEYEDGDEYEFDFSIDEDDDEDEIEEDIIEEVAEELDMDEGDVEDIIDIDFED